MKKDKTAHPAKFTDKFIDIFEEMIPENAKVLDPFAGTGKIHLLNRDTTGLEIEQEWACMHENTLLGDATNMLFDSDTFDVICTSPTYGNRMADSHNAKDKSKRNTYTHILGRKLSDNNSGKMQWGDNYRSLHVKAYKECCRVLKSGGIFILNIKNHIRKGEEIKVYEWHIEELKRLGFIVLEERKVKVKGNGFGSNNNVRVKHEYITKLRKV